MLLNALDIVNALKKQHAEVELVQLDSLTLEETAAVLANAKVLVAVSSDDMVSMALLPKGSTVVSIVPFGNPDRVWRPLAKRFGINYVAWHNKDRSKARFHPKLLSAYGVVGEEAEAIVNADHYDSEHHNWAGEFYWAMVFVMLLSHQQMLFHMLMKQGHNGRRRRSDSSCGQCNGSPRDKTKEGRTVMMTHSFFLFHNIHHLSQQNIQNSSILFANKKAHLHMCWVVLFVCTNHFLDLGNCLSEKGKLFWHNDL